MITAKCSQQGQPGRQAVLLGTATDDTLLLNPLHAVLSMLLLLPLQLRLVPSWCCDLKRCQLRCIAGLWLIQPHAAAAAAAAAVEAHR
jgi:uncharacterized membrane protein